MLQLQSRSLPQGALFRGQGELAEYLGVSKQTLANWAREGKGPKFIRLGARMVAYRVSDVTEWMTARENKPFDAAAAARDALAAKRAATDATPA